MNTNKLLTYADIEENSDFPYFKNEKERIKYITKAYKNMNLVKAFQVYYNLDLDQSLLKNKSITKVYNLEIGQIYNGNVDSFDGKNLTFTIPGVKSDIICKENFSDCVNEINNYLLNHNNQLLFEVKEIKNNTYYVSVISDYYKSWADAVSNAIYNNNGIEVHIDSLVKGGYIAHTTITTLYNLTGRNYTHAVFIPGSHIVLNIENDFEKWIGQNVVIVPQKFVDYKVNYKTGEVEKSLVGSRKKVLQIIGNQNLYDIYNKWKLASSNENVSFNSTYNGIVTGIINSKNKTGIFIEIDDMYITGLANINSIDLIDYKPGDQVRVRLIDMECKEGVEPFVFTKNGKHIKECNVRPVFELV